jgi:hypothetical protein
VNWNPRFEKEPGAAKAQPHEHFPAEDKSAQKPGAGRACLLAHSKSHGRHHRSGVRDRGGMGGIIFERVHELRRCEALLRPPSLGCVQPRTVELPPVPNADVERSQWAIAG